MKDLLNRIVLPPGLIMQSKIHGGYLVIVKQKNFLGGIPIVYSCLNKDSGLISDYGLHELDEDWLVTGYFDKTVTLLYGKKE